MALDLLSPAGSAPSGLSPRTDHTVLPRLAIVHALLGYGGGAEGLALAMISELARAGYPLHILTADPAGAAEASLRAYDPRLGPLIDARKLTFPATRTGRWLARFNRVTRRKPPVLLAYAALLREIKRSPRALDGVAQLINTTGECALLEGKRQICYIHHPVLPEGGPNAAALGGRLAKHPKLRRLITTFARGLSGFRSLPPDTLVLTNSRWSASEIQRLWSNCQPQVLYPIITPFPVPDTFEPRPDTAPSPFHVISLGRLLPYKGHDVIARAVARAAANNNCPAQITFVGRGSEADATLLAAMAAPQLTITVHRDASAQTIGQLIAKADLGVTAFPHEHFGMAAAEMQASGLPVLVPNGGGQTEVPPDARFLFEDEDDLAHILSRLMREPTALAQLRADVAPLRERFSHPVFQRELHATLAQRLDARALAPCATKG